MKRLFLIVLACLFGFALAEQEAEDAALQAMLSAHPDYEVLCCDQWGDSAAAVLGREDARILCIAERKSGEWTVTVDNDKAIAQGITPDILMDTDDALYWSYKDTMHYYSYSSFRTQGVWNAPMCIRYELLTEGMESYCEAEHRLENGMLSFVIGRYDVNENLLSQHTVGPYPAAWAMQYNTLNAYDDAVFPHAGNIRGESWLNWASLFQSALEIAPEYTFIEGAATENGLELLMEAPDGSLRMVTWAMTADGPVTNISSPLPDGSQYNDIHAYVHMPDGKSAVLDVYEDGVWYIGSVFTGENAEGVRIGRNWIAQSVWYGSPIYVGDHPWNSLNVAWRTLPETLDEALLQLDPSRWAVVNNPNPADRLHLRERANRSSRSNGKYYNGTPVEVLKKGSTWTKVRVPSGHVGWMMTEYLAFGKDAWKVQHAFPQLTPVETAETFPVWDIETVLNGSWKREDGDWSIFRNEPVYIIGIASDEMYYVWFPELDEAGCMRQSDFWAGNG